MKERISFNLEQDGFKGYFYEGTTNKSKVIIYLGSAMTDEEVTINSSEFLRNEGFSILALGFYLWKGLPKEMYHIPVEYTEKAVKWLKGQGYEKIAIMGASTGAGYALLCASLIPEINCVVVVSPLDYVMEGIKGMLFRQNCSMYTYGGKDLPCSKFAIYDKGVIRGLIRFFKKKEYDLPHIMRFSYDIADYIEESRIKVENMKADILMVAPKNDDCWPSEIAVERMERILKENNYPYRVQKTVYEKGSHALGYWIMNKKFKTMMEMAIPMEKEYPVECAQARKDSTAEILAFLEQW